MSKTILLSESSFEILRKLMIKEAVTPTKTPPPSPIFGNKDNYVGDLKTLSNIPNLRVDRYKDYELDNAWNAWKETGYDKNSEEYSIYLGHFKDFMFGSGGFLQHLSYTLERLHMANSNGRHSQVQLHQAILDKKWIQSVHNNREWKVSEANKNVEAFHCFYVTVLKLYQNPAIWNDFFFNPLFHEYVKLYTDMMSRIRLSVDKLKYLQILPKEEYVALNKFIGKMKELPDKTQVPEFNANTNQDAFYTGDMESGDEIFSTDDF